MSITINDRIISDDMIEREAAFHAGVAAPHSAAAHALAVRALLLDRASSLGIIEAAALDDDEACERAIAEVLAREAPVPEPTEPECRKYYDSHPAEFVSGELVEASHILLAVLANAPLDAIRRQAEALLKQAVAAPETFDALARQFSNCSSSAEGGNLGQLTRGATVPEFEQAVFDSEAVGVLPRLICTRYGFHLVKIAHRVAGQKVAFERVADQIAARLSEKVQLKAAEQYVRMLASRARIAGVDLGATGSLLVQ